MYGGRCGTDNGTLSACWQHCIHCLIATSRDSKGKVRFLASFVQFGVLMFSIHYSAFENTSASWYRFFLSCLRLYSCSVNCYYCHRQIPWLKTVVSQINLFRTMRLSLNLQWLHQGNASFYCARSLLYFPLLFTTWRLKIYKTVFLPIVLRGLVVRRDCRLKFF
jgi:hypothetical protein